MKQTLFVILIVLGLILAIALGGGLLVLLAYGVGWLLTRFLPFTAFEATLLALISLSLIGFAALQLAVAFITPSLSNVVNKVDEEDWGDDLDDEDFDEEDDDEEDEAGHSLPPTDYPGIPRWRQPAKRIDFSNTKPDDRCPCGSGRKYKNCHGRKTQSG